MWVQQSATTVRLVARWNVYGQSDTCVAHTYLRTSLGLLKALFLCSPYVVGQKFATAVHSLHILGESTYRQSMCGVLSVYWLLSVRICNASKISRVAYGYRVFILKNVS